MTVYCEKTDLENCGSFSPTKQDEAIAIATEIIDEHTGDSFAKEDNAVKMFSGKGLPTLLVSPTLRTLKKVESRVDVNAEWEDVPLTEVEWGATYVRRKYYFWVSGNQTVRITGDWGHASVPRLIKYACARLAEDVLTRGQSEPGGIKRETLGPYTLERDGTKQETFASMTNIMSILDKFMLHQVLGSSSPRTFLRQQKYPMYEPYYPREDR